MKKIFLKPKQGLIVRHPETLKELPLEGMEVIQTTYWNRRIKEGAVTVVVPESNLEKKRGLK